MSRPYLSIIVPIHDMKEADFFLGRLQSSLEEQTYTNFEVIITKEGKMAENTNAGIKRARGKIIKILYMDDFLTHEDSLQVIVDNFLDESHWMVTGCLHTDRFITANPHIPSFEGILSNTNTIGSPSVLTFRNDMPLLFDETLSWMLDVDLYRRLYDRYGLPKILNDLNVTIGIGDHQMTHILTDEEKLQEEIYIKQKHG